MIIMSQAMKISGLVAAVAMAACASAGSAPGGSGPTVSETFPFTAVKTVYVETPVVRLRGGAGGDMRSLENAVGDALREHFRRDLGWTAARTQGEADITARFELTDWESGSEGTRVGGALTLLAPDGETVMSASSVYPNRFGTGAPGPQIENAPNLFQSLLKPVKDKL